jgi:hypothetical protein
MSSWPWIRGAPHRKFSRVIRTINLADLTRKPWDARRARDHPTFSFGNSGEAGVNIGDPSGPSPYPDCGETANWVSDGEIGQKPRASRFLPWEFHLDIQ